ncbi:putative ATP-dependent helicase [Fonsecaea pedrosoi]|nr:putative ATP-dependent helicase [Fonsecaea pedrosoi]
MVREQQAPRNPLAPAMGNSQPAPDLQNREKVHDSDAPLTTQPLYPDLKNALAEQPQFGRPSMPGASPQPYARSQPLMRPGASANTSAPRQVSGNQQQDKYSNLFVSAKRPVQRPELHKPHVVANPLQALNGRATGQPPRPSSSRPSDGDDDFYEIAKPANFPAWKPPTVVAPTFSSQQPPNPYFRPTAIDLTQDRPTFTRPAATANNTFFRADHYEMADPSTYMNSSQANESIKALLEGAFEDEEDKPRTRRRKKELDKKVADLADMVKDMSVKSADKSEPSQEEADEGEEDDGVVPGLKVKLLPHQIDGVDWMVGKETGKNRTYGGILADDMGLGKTIQSIALILSNPKPSAEELEKSKRKLPESVAKGTLVVAPLALIRQWEGELKDRVDEDHALKICVHHGPQRTKSYKDLKKYDIVITTYQTLSSEHAGCSESLKVGCFGVHWYRIILDEAHSIKNRNAKASKAACALDAAYRWCLTGTPMQNGLDELQSLIHFLRIKPYCDLNEWRENITKPMNNGKGGLAVKRLRLILKSFMKRRTKDILKQEHSNEGGKGGSAEGGKDPGFKIVGRTVHNVEADFTDQEREFYKRLESRTDRSLEMMMAGNKMSYASALVLLMRLRQACNHPKLTGSDLSTETDASSGMQTPSRRKASTEDDMDSIANMLGGLSMETKRCDMCQIELTSRETAKGAIRCPECQEDLDKQTDYVNEMKKTKKEKRQKQEQKTVRSQRKQARRVVEDSDDEDDGDEKHEDEEETSSVGEEDEDDDEYSSSDDSSDAAPTVLQSTKIRQLLSILREDSHTHKYIVFSFFTSMLDLIEPFLRSNRMHYVRYDGKMRNDAREASLNALRQDPSTRVLLCSLRAGSLGLNLTAASRVVILEPFWNPFVEEQAIDRVHRLNQTQDVKVYKITIKGTVEERILELQEKKRELAKATIEGQGKKGAMRLNMQDMLRLFGREAESEHPVDVEEVGMGKGRSRGLLDASRDTSSLSNSSQAASEYGSLGGTNGSAGDRRDKTRVSDGKKKAWKEHEVYGRRW